MFAVPSISFYFMSIDEQIAQFGAPRKLIVDMIEKSGGACASIVNEAVREATRRLRPDVDMSSIPDGYAISLAPEIYNAENFTAEEIEAIKAHEEGHIVLGHIDAMYATVDFSKVTDTVVSTDKSIELQADEYAAIKVGAAHMLSALLKYPAAMARFLVAEGSPCSESQLAASYGWNLRTAHGDRIEALERMVAEGK